MGNTRTLPAAESFSIFPFLFLFCFYGTLVSSYTKYNTGAGVVEGKLNVHLVPHSHDDVGWLKTVDQYYVGSKNTIQGACVENVLDSVVWSLQKDPNRKFVFAEIAFFHRWWVEQSPETQEQVKKLVTAGRLEFVNGGWCMHDEATVHYIDMIDQTTLGHRFIKDQFNTTPRAGWQIDPFGHSAVQGYLLGAELGFDSVHFARIDYQDRAIRKGDKSLEVIWRGSKTFGSSAQIFANTFPVHYSAPNGFNFEVSNTYDPLQDDHLLFDTNIEQRVNDFIAAAIIQDGRLNALYSTPSIYTNAKNAENQLWPLKTDDYFPYADGSNAYWTGFFSSRPALKRYVRILSGYYLAARQLDFFAGFAGNRSTTVHNTFELGDALGLAQHHDAVSGTAKQHTTDDYAKRLAIGASKAEAVVSSSLACLANKQSGDQCSTLKSAFSQVVVVYNPLGWNRTDIVRIPVNEANLGVKDSSGNNLEVQYVDVDDVTKDLRKLYVNAYLGLTPKQAPKYWLLFQVSVPPLGWSTYFISKAAGKSTRRKGDLSHHNSKNGKNIDIGPGNLKMSFSSTSGQLERIYNSKTGVNVQIQQNYLWYASSTGDETDSQASGAYIFRPNDTSPHIVSRSVPFKVIRGPLVDEVYQKYSSWIYQVTRLYKGKDHAEIEYTIGPIPTGGGFGDGTGKEVITRITTNMATNKEFYTDSNGRDFLKRVRDHREDWPLNVTQPVAGNYYPLNLGIYTKDKKSEFSVLVDRATGGSSIKDGEVELMLHRRILSDDGRGVGEPLDEEVCVVENDNSTCEGLTVRGNYYISIDNVGAGSRWRRTTGQEIYSPLLLAFTHENAENWKSSHLTKGTVMDPNYSLPPNVALITLEELDGGVVLLRLAHLYEPSEDAQYSTLAKVELKKLFAKKRINELKEVSLSANQEKSEIKKMTWKVEGDKGQEQRAVRGGSVSTLDFVVELGPMEIRTFLLKF
ncbi:hypothetical protein TSUD_209840 [Trifolium subterraneum]|uniref:Alpha-mannosidase n=1 Tax=Trifolium subterraneum TaxID=3900 RepID=A0A2Z6NC48_TRISU|nr:hypothetical protein TSUD_209840 [Trifolium subterraneum]